MSAFLLPTDLDLCPHSQTHLFWWLHNSHGNPHSLIFQKNSPPSLYIVLDQGMGTKLNDLVVIALGFQTGDLGSNPIRGMHSNCPNVVTFLQQLFFMHKGLYMGFPKVTKFVREHDFQDACGHCVTPLSIGKLNDKLLLRILPLAILSRSCWDLCH